MKVSITPAILEKSFDAIQEAVGRVRGVAKLVQVDIVDGVYAPSASWPFLSGDGKDAAGSIVHPSEKELADKAECLYGLRVPFELDLMIQSPEDSLGVWLLTDATRFIIHRASTQYVSYCVNRVKDDGREVYLGLTAHDTLEGVASVLEVVDGVQCMGIAELGKQGEPYDERIETLIAAIHNAYPALPIQADGGVSVQTAPRLLAAGVTQFAVGSALFQGDVAENLTTLQQAVS
ncbi:MAG: hypothetical protein OXB96_02070 [Candidatus Kaiserbacteria bacterium]|nr:hypothetical protein [Candidatus Kaiserbacteria bacterium]